MTYDLPDNQLSSRFISCVTDIPVQNLLQNQLTEAHKSHDGYPFVSPHSEDIGDLERTQKLKNDILKKHNSGESK